MKNGKLFSKLSVIDFAVILLILVIVAVAVVRLVFFATPDKAVETVDPVTKVKCTVTLSFKEISAELLDSPIKEGEKMYTGSKYFGVVEKVEKSPTKLRIELADGSVVTRDSADLDDYTVTLTAELAQKDGMLYCGNNPIGVGNGRTFVSRFFSKKGYVTALQKMQ